MVRMRFLPDRRAYLLAHALLRIALADALEVSPQAVDLVYLAKGRPSLLKPQRQKIYFSLSRSREMVACVVTRAASIGVDVESLEPAYADLTMLSEFVDLPDSERGVGPAYDDSDPANRFFFYWTVLEAYWKARGEGLSSSHPRIRCSKGQSGYEVAVSGEGFVQSAAWAMSIQAPPGMMLSVVLDCLPPASGMGRFTVSHRDLDSVAWRQQTVHPGHSQASLAC